MSLEVFVEAGCESCDRALALADEIAKQFPSLPVSVIDISETANALPDAVFAVPTYVLNGRVVALGNPSIDDLADLIDHAQAG